MPSSESKSTFPHELVLGPGSTFSFFIALNNSKVYKEILQQTLTVHTKGVNEE
jgi:hypothetical protein